MPWEQVRKIFTQDRFFRIAVKLPGEAEANSVIKQWEEHTWRVLGQFCKSTYYGRLSQKVLKFYNELQKAAATCASTQLEFSPGWQLRCRIENGNWKAGYELVVSTRAPGRTRTLGLTCCTSSLSAVLAGGDSSGVHCELCVLCQ
jgi:outer membrane cobalamin receptor